MRKIWLLISTMMIIGLLLTACNVEGQNSNTGLIGETPGTGDNGAIPETGSDVDLTAQAGAEADIDLTAEVDLTTEVGVDTGAGSDLTATPSPGADLQTTETATADSLSGIVDTQTPTPASTPKGWDVVETEEVETETPQVGVTPTDAVDNAITVTNTPDAGLSVTATAEDGTPAGDNGFGLPLTGDLARGERFIADDPNLFALSELDGMTISASAGVEIGSVAGVVLDEDHMQVRYLLVERSTAGSGDVIAVPVSAFHFDEQTRVIPKRSSERANPSPRGQERGRGHQEQVISSTVLLVDVDQTQLNDAPGFPGQGDWRGWRGSVSEIDTYWRDAGVDVNINEDTSADAEVVWLDVDQLSQYDIRVQGDQVIGNVEDLVIDIQTGEVVYLLVGSDMAQNFYLVAPAADFNREGLQDDEHAFIFNGDLNSLQDLQWVESREELYWDIEE